MIAEPSLIPVASRCAEAAMWSLDRKGWSDSRGGKNLRLRIKLLASRLARDEVDNRTDDLFHECIEEAWKLLGPDANDVVPSLRTGMAAIRAAWRFDELRQAIGGRSVVGLAVSAEMVAEDWRAPVPPAEWAIIGHGSDMMMLSRDLKSWGWWLSPGAWFEKGEIFGELAMLSSPPFCTARDIKRARARIDGIDARRRKARLRVIDPERWRVRTAILQRMPLTVEAN